MKLKIIINEEIRNLFEGSADAYYEKFGMRNTAKDMDRKATAGIANLPPDPNEQPKVDPKGEFVGQIVDSYKNQTGNVYANPKSLYEFDANVRAVSSSAGDLFVIQYNLGIYHSKITNVVINSYNEGKTDFEVYDDAYDLQRNITWHRIEKTNDFGYSISTTDNLMGRPQLRPFVQKNLDAVREKNPTLNFIPIYWEKLRADGYDVQDIMQNNPYGFNNPGDNYRSKDQAMEMFQTEKEYIPIRSYTNELSKAWNLRELYRNVLDLQNAVRNNEEFDAFTIFADNIAKGLNTSPY
jgi:hypothetical protein